MMLAKKGLFWYEYSEPLQTSYDQSMQFCAYNGIHMCSYDELCPSGSGGAIFTEDGVEREAGDHWWPIRDTYNEWAQVGS